MKFFPLKNALVTLGKRFSVTRQVPIIALGTIAVILLTSWLSAIPSPANSVYPPIINDGAYLPFNKTCTPLEIDQFVAEFLEDVNTSNESEEDESADEGLPRLVACGEEAVPALIELLETEDEEILRSASLALQEIGSEAAEATPALIKLLEYPTSLIRIRAARALGTIGPAAETAVPSLIPLLQDSEGQVDIAAADALRAIGSAASIAIPDLIQASKNTDSSSNSFLEALAGLGEDGVLALTQLLQDPNSEIQAGATSALGLTGRKANSAVIAALIEALDNEHDQVCSSAAYALGRIANSNEVPDAFSLSVDQVIQKLVGIIRDREPCRRSAQDALSNIKNDEVVEPLVALLNEENRDIKLSAIESLRSVAFFIGKDAAEATTVLIEILKGEDLELASIAADSLGLIGPSASDSIPALITTLNHEEETESTEEFTFWSYDQLLDEATSALGQMGQMAVPQLSVLLSDSDQTRKVRALLALGEIGPDAQAAVPDILPLLQSSDKKIQLLAAITLGKIGVEADAVLPILIPALRNIEDSTVRGEIADAIGGLGAAATPAISDLIWVIGTGSLYSEDWAMRDSTIQALINIGPSAVPLLTEALGNENTVIAARSSFALAEIGSETIPAMIAALDDPNVEVQRRAAFVLTRIGPEAIPTLLEALQSGDSNTRKGAAYALGTIYQPVDELIQLLENIVQTENSSLDQRRIAAFALSSDVIYQPSDELIRSLEGIIQNESNSLDEQRVAASALDLMGQDVSWFFEQNALISPKNAACPIRIGLNEAEFDIYTGQCLMSYSEDRFLAGGGGLINALCSFFGC